MLREYRELVPQAVECNSEETVLPEIVLAPAPDGNWVNADFIDGASLNSQLDMAVHRTCLCLL